MKIKWFALLSSLLISPLLGQSIAEKKSAIEHGGIYLDLDSAGDLKEVNSTLSALREQLKELYHDANRLYDADVNQEHFFSLLQKINLTKEEIKEVELLWKKEMASSAKEEQYGLMHASDLLLSEFVMDYGSSDYLYIIPPEMDSLRLHISSNIPIPKESWHECLECILAEYGISIRSINTYIKELYFSSNRYHGLAAITDSLEKLALMPAKDHICFIMSEEESDPRGALLFFKKFCNLQTTTVELFGGRIFILSSVESIQELFKLYNFVKTKTGKQEIQLITLSKIDAKEMASILQIAFNEGPYPADESNIRIMPLQSLPHSLVLAGSKEEVKRAKKIIEDVESKLQDPDESTLFWYTAKHSDPKELADIVAQVYDLFVQSPSFVNNEKIDAKIAEVKKTNTKEENELGVAPSKITHAKIKSAHDKTFSNHNFVVDSKTGSIMMVVKRDLLPQIKQLLKKLDVPKKMVQIEVLLFEKKMENHSKCGLNLLKLGSAAANTFASGATFHNGILDFFISRDKGKGSGIPAYDLAYTFLLGQDDVQINASPSVTTMNQTPATIAIVEEISLDAGSDDKKNRIYHRAQYGITLLITPTINMDIEEEGEQFITLETDITFDTTKNGTNDRPDVTRRHIKNHVRIKDGETLILGGLRRKNQEDKKDSIPFLGEIPGLGKLFGSTETNDSSTEMFVFITPKILSDPIEEIENTKLFALTKRAGDVPEFLKELDISKDKQKRKLFERSLASLFGRKEEDINKFQGEYDGHE